MKYYVVTWGRGEELVVAGVDVEDPAVQLVAGVFAVSAPVTPAGEVNTEAVTAAEREAGARGQGEAGGEILLAALSVVTDHPVKLTNG